MEKHIDTDNLDVVKEKLLVKIAKKIRRLRNDNQVTQRKFYDDTRIHIARIEQGRVNISISTLCDICSYFKVNFRDFFAEFA